MSKPSKRKSKINNVDSFSSYEKERQKLFDNVNAKFWADLEKDASNMTDKEKQALKIFKMMYGKQ